MKLENIEQHSSEVQEIMGEIPGRVVRWGLLILFLVFAGLIAGSFFFKMPEVVSAPLVITTLNPPAPVISKVSGRIAKWFVADGQSVSSGENIVYLSNSTLLPDFFRLEQLLETSDSVSMVNPENCLLPEKLVLGELQESYSTLYRNWKSYREYISGNFLPQKIELLRQQMKKQEEHFKLSVDQQKMMEEELAIARKGLLRHEGLLDKGGVSASQIDDARARVIQSERGYTSFIASLKTAEINLISQRRSLLELQEQHAKETSQFQSSISENVRTLKNLAKNWREKYLLSSPVYGKVTFTRFWGENQSVNAGERLVTIVPADSSVVICRAMVSSAGIAKVKPGQVVNIKLSGFPYMEFGILKGIVSSASLVPDEKGYTVEIRLLEGMLSSYSERLGLVQEMDGTAEIVTSDKRLIYRLINPLRMIFDK